MFRLERVHLVQFFLFQAKTLEFDGTTAIIAPNGAGKSALLDALQIVMLGADRNLIRFNAQAGGTHRARTIRDYCLGVFRAGDDGRVRDTATTYVSLVFRDEASGEALTAGIALGASVDEADHRVHGLYLLPGVALDLADHLETVDGAELPLAWAQFRAMAAERCKRGGTRLELHGTSERFLKDMLLRLRPGPTAFLDAAAYRKAFQNALNLQRVDNVDLFVRHQVAEDRPTDIGRFRALLEGFREIREKIEQVAQRIASAETVEQQYRKIAGHATRAASYRALAAEYRRDAHSDNVDAAEQALEAAERTQREKQRALEQARSDGNTARLRLEEAQARLQGTRGYSEQSSFEEITGRDRDELAGIKRELLRSAGFVRDQLLAAGKLELPTVDARALDAAVAPWRRLYDGLAALHAEAEIGLDPQALDAELRAAIAAAQPAIAAVKAHAHSLRSALDDARHRSRGARENLARVQAGQAELRADAVRLMNYLQDEGIPCRPVCDLVQVTDAAWQPAVEAYLRNHVEALLIPVEHEQRAVRLYRGLQGARSVYGVKLALTSQARQARMRAPEDGQVAALLGGDEDAVAYLRRQVGDLRCVDSEREIVDARHGLSRDGIVVKGGGIERLRLPAATELKIGASDNRQRVKQLREEIERAENDARRLETEWKRADDSAGGFAAIGSGAAVVDTVHAALLRHREAHGRFDALRERRRAFEDPDLMRLSEDARTAEARCRELDALRERLVGEVALAGGKVDEIRALLARLEAESERVARLAVDAYRHPDVDANLVEQHREELDEKYEALHERVSRCESRAEDAEKALGSLVPEAWSGLAQYAKDNGIALDLDAGDWRKAADVLGREIAHLKGTELVQHQARADEAYSTAVDTFRANVASTLYDNFVRLKHQIDTLNRTLLRSPVFSNNERYRFRYDVVPELKALHTFILKVADVGAEDTLFGSAGDVPEAFREIVEDKIVGKGGVSPLDDYRRFFSFEVEIRQGERTVGTLSERMRSGSGGEHRAPMYVIAGAALAAAYGKSEGQSGGLGLMMLDEFGDKIDAQNARAITGYLRSLGLQLVLAAPDTAQGTLSGVLDSYIELFRDDRLLQVERIVVTDAGRTLMHSDQFHLHPELLEAEIARVEAERTEAARGQADQAQATNVVAEGG